MKYIKFFKEINNKDDHNILLLSDSGEAGRFLPATKISWTAGNSLELKLPTMYSNMTCGKINGQGTVRTLEIGQSATNPPKQFGSRLRDY